MYNSNSFKNAFPKIDNKLNAVLLYEISLSKLIPRMERLKSISYLIPSREEPKGEVTAGLPPFFSSPLNLKSKVYFFFYKSTFVS